MKRKEKKKVVANVFPPKGYRVVPVEELRAEAEAQDAPTAPPDIVSQPLEKLRMATGLGANDAADKTSDASASQVKSVVIEPKDMQHSSGVRKTVLLGPDGKPIACQG